MKFKLHRYLASLFGYELIRKSKLVEITAAPDEHLALLLKTLKVNHVLDVGANVGQYASSLRALGYRGKITSFEPVSACVEKLQQVSENDEDWKIWHCALGDKDAEIKINVTTASAFSSILEPNEYAINRYKRITIENEELVPVRRLDSIFSDIVTSDDRVYLKLDTQGYDLAVFNGALNILDQIFGMQSELSVTAIYEAMPDYLTALSEYQAQGFSLTGLFPIAWDEATLKVIEFDGYMRRESTGPM